MHDSQKKSQIKEKNTTLTKSVKLQKQVKKLQEKVQNLQEKV